MEKCKKVCKDVRPSGEDQHGNKYFWIDFEDKSSGLFGCKEQDLFQVGQESEFYFEPKVGKENKEYNKIRRVSSVEYDDGNTQKKDSIGSTSGSGNVKSKENIEQINRSVSIKAACHLLTGSTNNTPDRVLEAAEIFNDYISFGITDKQPANVAATMKSPTDATPLLPPQEITSNELPF